MKKLFIARDKSGELYLYNGEPIRDTKEEWWDIQGKLATRLDSAFLPEITWEDDAVPFQISNSYRLEKENNQYTQYELADLFRLLEMESNKLVILDGYDIQKEAKQQYISLLRALAASLEETADDLELEGAEVE